jgi:hypothetical protein
MDAFDPSFDDWASDHVLSGANWNEEEYNSRIVQSPLNASLAGDTDSLIITASFMASWADRGVASVSHGFFDPQEICKQAQFNDAYHLPPARTAFLYANQQNLAGSTGFVLPYNQEESP